MLGESTVRTGSAAGGSATSQFESTWTSTIVVTGDDSTRTTRASAVQAAIDEAVAEGKEYVFVPEDFTNYDASAVTFDASVMLFREIGLTDMYDVKAYGAAGDGPTGTDDLAAINAAAIAADANGFERVWHPPGVYTVSAAPTFPGETTPVGVGASFDGHDRVMHASLDERLLRSRVTALVMMAVEDLEQELNEIAAGFGSARRVGINTDAYSITNDLTDRTFDADTVTVAELADVVATLIRDLGRDS